MERKPCKRGSKGHHKRISEGLKRYHAEKRKAGRKGGRKAAVKKRHTGHRAEHHSAARKITKAFKHTRKVRKHKG
jgi:hypothetical protein